MIYYDGIIKRLQRNGGISVLFDEVIKRLPDKAYVFDIPSGGVALKRYLPVFDAWPGKIFHSTYYRYPRKKGCGVVTTVHDFTYEKYVRGARRMLHSWQKKSAIENSDIVICVSNNTRDDLLEFYGDHFRSRSVVIPNGVSGDYFPECVSRKNQALFVGARAGYKNFRSAVIALSRFHDIQLRCVGGGGFTKDEVSFLQKRLPGRFSHAGFISNQELNREYNSSAFLIYPSVYEGFGIPILEAMRAGCPVIAVRASSVPEVAGSAACLVASGDVDDLVSGIEFLMDECNQEMHRVLGFSQANRFTWDVTFEKTMAVYNKLVGFNILDRV